MRSQTLIFSGRNLGDYAKHAESFINADDSPFFLSVNYPDPHDPWIRQVDGLPKHPQSMDDVQVMEYMGIESPEFREMVADYYNCISRMDSLVGESTARVGQIWKGREYHCHLHWRSWRGHAARKANLLRRWLTYSDADALATPNRSAGPRRTGVNTGFDADRVGSRGCTGG